MNILYLPSILCPSCEEESDWDALENSAQYPDGIECPFCGKAFPINQYHIIPKWGCSACNSDMTLTDFIDNGNDMYACPICGCEGTLKIDIKKFEVKQREDGDLYHCPYCDEDILASDLIPDGKGEIIICPVCGKFAEI
jgi:transcription elongation factor Elf1